MNIEIGIWKNNKNGANYHVVDTLLNATNDRNGQIMVRYLDKDGNAYCREINEFLEKFTKECDV